MTFEAFVVECRRRLPRFRLVERTTEQVTLRDGGPADLLQIENVVHGGILATSPTRRQSPPLRRPARRAHADEHEFKVNFLRPALLGAGEVVALARVVQRGRRVAVCDVDVTQAGSLAAKGLFTYLFLERERSRPQ
jgi:acyl-coenzyme A thioesterase PaaI-like protein